MRNQISYGSSSWHRWGADVSVQVWLVIWHLFWFWFSCGYQKKYVPGARGGGWLSWTCLESGDLWDYPFMGSPWSPVSLSLDFIVPCLITWQQSLETKIKLKNSRKQMDFTNLESPISTINKLDHQLGDEGGPHSQSHTSLHMRPREIPSPNFQQKVGGWDHSFWSFLHITPHQNWNKHIQK